MMRKERKRMGVDSTVGERSELKGKEEMERKGTVGREGKARGSREESNS